MTLLFTILIVVVCILLVLVILVQNPKGGGLSSAFGGDSPQMLGGVKKTTDFLDKSTWYLVIALFVLVIGMNMMSTDTVIEQDSVLDIDENAVLPMQSDPLLNSNLGEGTQDGESSSSED